MPTKPLAKLEYVDLREVWADEARDFTPWLASDEGLELLGKTIGLELERVKEEAEVGSFAADILARAGSDEEHLVVIENQFGKTNHDHLGKLITYSSGLKVRTAVWVASKFNEEHRQALDWLNESTDQEVSFFGLEIKLFRIGNSIPAPQFTVVASPNSWAKVIKQGPRGGHTETKLQQKQFWDELKEYMESKGTFLRLPSGQPKSWYWINIGRSGFGISLTLNTLRGRAGCEIYINNKDSKKAFDQLIASKQAIEHELGYPLEWQRLEGKQACRIVVYRSGNIGNGTEREDLKSWFHTKAEGFHKVLAPRIKNLKLYD